MFVSYGMEEEKQPGSAFCNEVGLPVMHRKVSRSETLFADGSKRAAIAFIPAFTDNNNDHGANRDRRVHWIFQGGNCLMNYRFHPLKILTGT